MSAESAGSFVSKSSVYSLTKAHDRKQKRQSQKSRTILSPDQYAGTLTQPIMEEQEEVDSAYQETLPPNYQGTGNQNVFRTMEHQNVVSNYDTFGKSEAQENSRWEEENYASQAVQEQAAVQNEYNEAVEAQELQALQMLTGCVSEMSSKYEAMARKFTERLDGLESAGASLAQRQEALQEGFQTGSTAHVTLAQQQTMSYSIASDH